MDERQRETSLNRNEEPTLTKTHVHEHLASRSCDSVFQRSKSEDGKPGPQNTVPEPIYRNSLLIPIGLLDLTNALDFPANVWNQVPIPTYSLILMGLGGSIALLAISIAVWDMLRCRRNIAFLRHERACLLRADKRLIERAWLRVNTRELCWEVIDRFFLDFFMAVTGLFVGTGTLLAIRGADRTIFHVSNILSGYLGNSFLAFYALVNGVWSGVMFHRARRNAASVKRSRVERGLAGLMKRHAWKHQIYAVVNGTTLVVSGVASIVSATMWQGYVVQVPCVVVSLGVVCFWRLGLGYDRLSWQRRCGIGEGGLELRVRAVIRVRTALEGEGRRSFTDIIGGDGGNVADFLRDLGLREDFEARLAQLTPSSQDEEEKESEERFSQAVNQCIEAAGVRIFRYEERFLLELYGYHLREKQLAHAESKV